MKRERAYCFHGDVRAADRAMVASVWLDDLTAVTVADGAGATGSVDWEIGRYLPQQVPAVHLTVM